MVVVVVEKQREWGQWDAGESGDEKVGWKGD